MGSEINFRITTPSLQRREPVRYSPDTGIINSAIIHFPSGCDQLVEVLIYLGTKQILPTPVPGQGAQVGIALDDTTQSFDIRHPIERNDPVQVVVLNHDNTYPHTISVIVLIAKEETYTGP